MVTYGPWIDPPLADETVVVGMATTSPASRPITRQVLTSGVGSSGLTVAWARSKAIAELVAPASPVPEPGPAEEAWNLLPGELMQYEADYIIPGFEGAPEQQAVVSSYLRHTGSHIQGYPDTSVYTQADFWHWGVTSWMLAQNPATPFYNPITAGEAMPPGAVSLEHEVYGEPAELVSVTVAPQVEGGNPGEWTMRVLPGGGGGSPASLRDGTFETVAEMRTIPALSGDYVLDGAELAAMQDAMRANHEPAAPPDSARVEFALTYSGPYPGSLAGVTIAGPHGNEWIYTSDATMTLYVTYRTPRYRWIFDTVPYRRVYPRPDGLAGGAPRTYPRPKTQQASNRIVGGIF